ADGASSALAEGVNVWSATIRAAPHRLAFAPGFGLVLGSSDRIGPRDRCGRARVLGANRVPREHGPSRTGAGP
ncbi:MAG: hypothetical protein AAFP86_08750, partial [Planctomycetota bacterium]